MINGNQKEDNNKQFHGPLSVSAENPRYFTDETGKAIYLTGAHTWEIFQDRKPFDATAYFKEMSGRQFNFMRLWHYESDWLSSPDDRNHADPFGPLPYLRTGPGQAADGQPRYDLTCFNPDYFAQLRARVIEAGENGIYVAVMLFEGWSVEIKIGQQNPWTAHPFHVANNINGIDGDPAGTGQGKRIHTLELPEVTAIQKAYVKKVIETVNDLDNVLYEISNESGNYATAWQYEIIRTIHQYERQLARQHPVFMTYYFPDGNNYALFNSPAEAISPSQNGLASSTYMFDPPPADGRKIIIVDTDHVWGIGGNPCWIWKCFTRGLQPIFMDDVKHEPWELEIYRAMTDTLSYSQRINLNRALPSGFLTSTAYCLADSGNEYLIYQPEVAPFFVWLTGVEGKFTAEWFNPHTSETMMAEPVAGGSVKEFRPPFQTDSVLYLQRINE